MPKTTDYMTKVEIHAEFAAFRDEMRTMLNETVKVVQDHFNVLYKESQEIKLVLSQHTRQIDELAHAVADLSPGLTP